MATSTEAGALLGGFAQNFLDVDDQFFESSTGSWTTTNSTSSVDFTFRFREQYHTLKVLPSDTSAVSITHSPVLVSSSLGTDSITFFFHAYSSAKTTFTVTITDSFGSTESRQVIANALQWTVIRGPELLIPQTQGSISYTASISVTGHQAQAIYIACPVMTNKYGMSSNRFLRYCMRYLPEILIQTDYEQTFPNFPMLRLLDVGTAYAGVGTEQADSFRYLDIASGYDADNDLTKSTLVDYSVAEARFLPWLAQIVGVKLAVTAGGTTPWGNIPSTWATFLDAIDNAGTDDDVPTWEEVETYNTSDANFVAGRREQIQSARLGQNAGTSSAIIASAQTVLTGTKTVELVIDPISSPWTIDVQTLISETPGGSSNYQALLDACEQARPVGFVLTHTAI